MKRVILTALCAACLAGYATIPLAAQEEPVRDEQTMHFSLGLEIRFNWWRPPWRKFTPAESILYGAINPEIRPTALFGPVISLDVNNSWRVNTRLLFGEHTIVVYKPVLIVKKTSETSARFFDVEATAGYALTKNVRISFGGRYLGYIADMRYLRKYRAAGHSGGPIAGFGFTVPMGSSFYFLAGISGLVLGGIGGTGSSCAAGGEASASFAYSIESIHSMVSIGGSYRYLRYIYTGNSHSRRNDDHNGGIIFSLVYRF